LDQGADSLRQWPFGVVGLRATSCRTIARMAARSATSDDCAHPVAPNRHGARPRRGRMAGLGGVLATVHAIVGCIVDGQAIKEAMIRGDVTTLAGLAAAGTSILLDSGNELTALHLAAAAGRTEVVPGILVADFEDLLTLRPAAVILTRGVQLVLQVPETTVAYARASGAEVLVLQSEDAVAEYNRRERREPVVALIHSTC